MVWLKYREWKGNERRGKVTISEALVIIQKRVGGLDKGRSRKVVKSGWTLYTGQNGSIECPDGLDR